MLEFLFSSTTHLLYNDLPFSLRMQRSRSGSSLSDRKGQGSFFFHSLRYRFSWLSAPPPLLLSSSLFLPNGTVIYRHAGISLYQKGIGRMRKENWKLSWNAIAFSFWQYLKLCILHRIFILILVDLKIQIKMGWLSDQVIHTQYYFL